MGLPDDRPVCDIYTVTITNAKGGVPEEMRIQDPSPMLFSWGPDLLYGLP